MHCNHNVKGGEIVCEDNKKQSRQQHHNYHHQHQQQQQQQQLQQTAHDKQQEAQDAQFIDDHDDDDDEQAHDTQLHALKSAGHSHGGHTCNNHQRHYHQHQLPPAPAPPQRTVQQHQTRSKSRHNHHAHYASHSHHASPHNSRHTSPHNQSRHHSHSCHTSPHQSQVHVHKTFTSDEAQLTDKRFDAHHPHRHGHHGYVPSSQNSQRKRRRAHSHNAHHAMPNGEQGCVARKHRSVMDISSSSLNNANNCQDPLCMEGEVPEVFVRKNNCCSTSSRTELAQYFAEDLYGTASRSSRRPSSCCTSSDYCYQTDSTSLYGSRSSLSRNNSIKSACATLSLKKSALQAAQANSRQPIYPSLRARSQPNSKNGSLNSIFAYKHHATDMSSVDAGSKKLLMSPSKSSLEHRHSSKEALSNDLPEYACSPSPIRWSFLEEDEQNMPHKNGRKASIASEREYYMAKVKKTSWKKSVDELPSALKRSNLSERERDYTRERKYRGGKVKRTSWKNSMDDMPHVAFDTSAQVEKRKNNESPFKCDFEETSTVLFHQEGESFNNCCNNYIQCNSYLDQDLQITSEDIHQYMAKGQEQRLTGEHTTDVNNGNKNYPFQPTNALEYQYKSNFANNPTQVACSSSCCQQHDNTMAKSTHAHVMAGSSSNLNSSSNNINIVFKEARGEANEVKFINTERQRENSGAAIVSTEAHHSGYLPYTYPSYDYTNMSCNLYASTRDETSDDHSSLLQSPEPAPHVSFESFDAASQHKLLSPLSPRSHSPASSSLSASTNATSGTYTTHPHHHYQEQQQQSSQQAHAHHYHPHQAHQYHQHHQHNANNAHLSSADSFKLSNTFRSVRKRARNFLRKK